MIRYFSDTGHTLKAARPGDVGFDLPVKKDILLGRYPVIVSTGVFLEMPAGTYASVVPRSSAAVRRGIAVCTGTIDQGYRGEIGVAAYVIGWQSSHDDILLMSGDHIAQLVFGASVQAELAPVASINDISQSERGASGFGSANALEFFFNGKIWSGSSVGAIARIKHCSTFYAWFSPNESGAADTISECITDCMRSLGIGDERHL